MWKILRIFGCKAMHYVRSVSEYSPLNAKPEPNKKWDVFNEAVAEQGDAFWPYKPDIVFEDQLCLACDCEMIRAGEGEAYDRAHNLSTGHPCSNSTYEGHANTLERFITAKDKNSLVFAELITDLPKNSHEHTSEESLHDESLL